MTEELLIMETEAGVRTMTFNRPGQRNAFNNPMYHALSSALDEAVADSNVGAILLSGAGGTFCAGQDMSEFAMPEDGTSPGFVRLLEALMRCDKPIVTAVAGFGVGIGATMLLHTDMNFMATDARLRFPFVALGVVPEAAASAMLPALMGYQRAADILLTARWVSAPECVEVGLALKVVNGDELLETATAAARDLAAAAPNAVRATKRLMKAASRDLVSQALEREYAAFPDHLGTPENLEAIQAFFEKRKPNFRR